MSPSTIQKLFYRLLPLLLTAPVTAAVTLQPSQTVIAVGHSGTFTVTVPQGAPVQYVRLTYQGISGYDELTSPPYVFQKQFDTPADDLIVTATVRYSNGAPDESDTATIDVVGLKLTGSTAPFRGYPVAYKVQTVPAGHALGDVTWSYTVGTHVNTHNVPASGSDSTTWAGQMVVSGLLGCTTTIAGQTISISETINLTARPWITPIECRTDNEGAYGQPPGINPYGEHRDRLSNSTSIIFTPRTAAGSYSPSLTLGTITMGPCAGWWYIAACTLKADMETVINRYIKPNGPDLDGETFEEANFECFDSLEAFVQAVMNHEYRGTPPTPESLFGHHGRTEYAVRTLGYDPRALIEHLAAKDMNTLYGMVDTIVGQCEINTRAFAHDETWRVSGPNWGSGPTALGSGGHNAFDGEGWGVFCLHGPYDF